MNEPRTFEEFWPYYVSQHANPMCRTLHFVGTTLAFSCLVASPVVPWLLAVAPVVGYGLAWIGHFGFEGNKPASWFSARHLAWSFLADMRMWGRIATGRMGAEVARAAELYAPAE